MTLSRSLSLIASAVALSASLIPSEAQAQRAAQFPARAIRIVVPFTPGGPNDVLARLVGQKLTEAWGQQVMVDSRPGGGTVIGTELVAKSAPDGHTLLMVSISTAVNASLRKNLPYDTVKDFAPVIRLAASPNVLVVHPSLPARSVSDLLRLAKAKPGDIAYASGGVGAATHLAGALLCLMGGVQMTHIPYKGAAPATVDLLSGQVTWMFGSIIPLLPFINAGRLRALAVSSDERSAALPGIPTVAETLSGFEATSWYGLFAPVGTPREVVAKLNEEIARIVRVPEMREQFRRQGAEPVGDTPQRFEDAFKAEIVKWAKVTRAAGISAD